MSPSRKTFGRLVFGFALGFMLCAVAPAGAAPIFVFSYLGTPGEGIAQGGTLNYFDETGGQLTDGVFGDSDWSANLGSGAAYEWVGWKIANPTITFTFAGPVTIDEVHIGFNRNDFSGINLPCTVTIGGTDFAVAPGAIPDVNRGTLSFAGSWSGPSLTVALDDDEPARWIFVDEIFFVGTVIPEPSALTLLVAGLGLLKFHRRRRGQS